MNILTGSILTNDSSVSSGGGDSQPPALSLSNPSLGPRGVQAIFVTNPVDLFTLNPISILYLSDQLGPVDAAITVGNLLKSALVQTTDNASGLINNWIGPGFTPPLQQWIISFAGSLELPFGPQLGETHYFLSKTPTSFTISGFGAISGVLFNDVAGAVVPTYISTTSLSINDPTKSDQFLTLTWNGSAWTIGPNFGWKSP